MAMGTLACQAILGPSLAAPRHSARGTPAPGVIQDIQGGYAIAQAAASRALPESHLIEMIGYYQVYQGQWFLDHVEYQFVSRTDSTIKKLFVNLAAADATVENAIREYQDKPGIFTDALPLDRVKFSEREALGLAWEQLGRATDSQCGPVTSIEAEVYALFGTPPHWQITYIRDSVTLAKSFIDGESGQVIENRRVAPDCGGAATPN